MHVITVGQSKGGVGKTTIAINVAAEISRLGCSVTVIDSDPQRSAVMWAEPKRLDFTVREELLDDGNVTGWIRNILKLQTDIVVIDTRSGLDKTFETAVFISDLVVVPCGPSSLDILSARRTVLRTRELASANANQHTRSVIVPTRVDFSSEEGRQITSELENITDLMGPLLSYDMDFVRSFSVGRSVSAFSPGRPADIEVRTLTAFLLKKLYMNPW